jgi:hypothetical protein
MPLAKDPDRWELAFVERAIRVGAVLGIAELRIIDTYVTRKLGTIVLNPLDLGRLEPLRRGRPGFWMWMPESKHLAALQMRNKRLPAPWRYEHAFRPPIDDVGRTLRRYRRREEDARQLQAMIDVWEICLGGDVAEIEDARRLALSEEKKRPRFFPDIARLKAPDLI